MPTYDLLREVAESAGFATEERFFYVLRNRHLASPAGHGAGSSQTDCVQVFRKEPMP